MLESIKTGEVIDVRSPGYISVLTEEKHAVIIPFSEFLVFNKGYEDEKGFNRRCTTFAKQLIGTMIDFVVQRSTGTRNDKAYIGSYLKACEVKQQYYFNEKDEAGKYRVIVGDVIPCTVVNIRSHHTYLEIYGFTMKINTDRFTIMFNQDKKLKTGDTVDVRLTRIVRDENGNLKNLDIMRQRSISKRHQASSESVRKSLEHTAAEVLKTNYSQRRKETHPCTVIKVMEKFGKMNVRLDNGLPGIAYFKEFEEKRIVAGDKVMVSIAGIKTDDATGLPFAFCKLSRKKFQPPGTETPEELN